MENISKQDIKGALEAVWARDVSDNILEQIISEKRYIIVESNSETDVYSKAKEKGIDMASSDDGCDAILMGHFYIWICKSFYAISKNGEYYINNPERSKSNGFFIKGGHIDGRGE